MRARLALAAAVALALASCSKESPSEKAAAPGPPPPPPEKLRAALAELNELCVDLWCEGDYEFTFKKLECTSAIACTLSFEAVHDESDRSTVASLALTGFGAILDSEGYPTETFENAVNDAIAEWETKQGG